MASEVEKWLHGRLSAAFPSLEEWVLEGVCSALTSIDNKPDAIDTVVNFLGEHPGTHDLIAELFQRKQVSS